MNHYFKGHQLDSSTWIIFHLPFCRWMVSDMQLHQLGKWPGCWKAFNWKQTYIPVPRSMAKPCHSGFGMFGMKSSLSQFSRKVPCFLCWVWMSQWAHRQTSETILISYYLLFFTYTDSFYIFDNFLCAYFICILCPSHQSSHVLPFKFMASSFLTIVTIYK